MNIHKATYTKYVLYQTTSYSKKIYMTRLARGPIISPVAHGTLKRKKTQDNTSMKRGVEGKGNHPTKKESNIGKGHLPCPCRTEFLNLCHTNNPSGKSPDQNHRETNVAGHGQRESYFPQPIPSYMTNITMTRMMQMNIYHT